MKRLRFKDENGNDYPERITRLLGDLATISTGDLNVQDALDDGQYPFYDRSTEIKTLNVYSFDKEAILYAGEGSEFYPRYYFGKFALHQRAYAIYDFESSVNPRFLYHYLHTQNHHFIKTAVGSTVKSLRMICFEKCKVELPVLPEQEKIGSFFGAFDTLISKQKEKVELLKELKKGYLQQLFPEKGSTIPKLRFDGFTDAWEQRELSELAHITMGQSPNGINYTSNPEDNILVQGNADMQNGWVTPRVWTTQITKTAEPNDLIFSVRAPVGAVGKTQFKAVIGRGVASIRGNEFVFQELLRLNMNNHWKTISTGSTFDSINSTELKTTPVKAPQIDEQNKIGYFLKSVDTLITLHQRKVDYFELMKKGYMQRLFVQK
jgi:type I restriction enzyme S subunit